VRGLKKVLVLFVCFSIFLSAVLVPFVHADEFEEDEPFVEVITNGDDDGQKMPAISAASAIVMDANSGRVLYEKNAYTRRPMASTTKIMTAIVAIEKGKLDDVVTVSKTAASVGGSTIRLKAGEKLTLLEMLYGLMLRSGNDAAIAIAEHIGGSVDKFLDMMNKKAELLGAKNTQFKSPHGLDKDGHYSTAYDLALITRYALNNPVFSRIVGTKSVQITARSLHNTNEMLSLYPGADGVKTGYTGLAGRCLVTSATRAGWRIISVVLNCPSRSQRAQSSKAILDYAFNNYKPYTILKAEEEIRQLPVIKGTAPTVSVKSAEEITLPLKRDEVGAIEARIELPDSLEAPVYAGEDIGVVEYAVKGRVIAQSPLKIWEDVRRKYVIDYLMDILRTWSKMMHEGIFAEP